MNVIASRLFLAAKHVYPKRSGVVIPGETEPTRSNGAHRLIGDCFAIARNDSASNNKNPHLT